MDSGKGNQSITLASDCLAHRFAQLFRLKPMESGKIFWGMSERLSSWCMVLLALSAVGSRASNAWIVTNSFGSDPVAADGLNRKGFEMSPSGKLIAARTYSNGEPQLFAKASEGLVGVATAKAVVGDRLVASYDFRSSGTTDTDGVSDEELTRLWQKWPIVFKASYFRGRIFDSQPNASTNDWITVFASGDRRRLVFVRDSGPICFSETMGTSWNRIRNVGRYEFTIASSPQGSSLVAAICIQTQPESTTNKAVGEMAGGSWYAVVSEAEGARMVLAGGARALAPALTISKPGSEVVVSWPASFTGFELQRSYGPIGSDWFLVTNEARIIAGQRVVALPLRDENSFFRLKAVATDAK